MNIAESVIRLFTLYVYALFWLVWLAAVSVFVFAAWRFWPLELLALVVMPLLLAMAYLMAKDHPF